MDFGFRLFEDHRILTEDMKKLSLQDPLVIFEQSLWLRKVSKDRKKENDTLIFKDSEIDPENRPWALEPDEVSSTVSHMNKMLIKSSFYGTILGKCCLTNLLITFYSEMTGLANEERSEDTEFFDFRKAFYSATHKILREKLTRYSPDGQTDRQRHGKPTEQTGAERGWLVTRNTNSSWRATTTSVSQGSTLAPVLFN